MLISHKEKWGVEENIKRRAKYIDYLWDVLELNKAFHLLLARAANKARPKETVNNIPICPPAIRGML